MLIYTPPSGNELETYTHYYDGKIQSNVETYEIINEVKNIDFNIKKPHIITFISTIILMYNSTIHTNEGKLVFDFLTNVNVSLHNSVSTDIDMINKMGTYDLIYILAIIYYKLNTQELKVGLLTELYIQFLDMITTGMCPQGQTIRLFQVISAYKDWYLI